MNFRMADSQDISSISALSMAMTRKFVVSDFSDEAATKLLASLSENGIANCIKNDVVYHVAELDGRIVGLIGVHSNRHIYHLFVEEAQQRQGIARRLWNMARELCLLNGNNEKITVNSSLYAKAAYEKLGFHCNGEPRIRNGITTVAMEYPLNSR